MATINVDRSRCKNTQAMSRSGEALCFRLAVAGGLTLNKKVMKKKLVLLFAALFCVSGMSIPAVNAQVNISVGASDLTYNVHGPGYWNGRDYYGWAPGYWGWHHHHRYWHHGYYHHRYYRR